MSQYNLHVVQGTEVQFYIMQVTNTKCKSHRHSTEADILNGYDRLRLRQNGWQFPHSICKFISWNENYCICIQFSLKFIPKRPISNMPARSISSDNGLVPNRQQATIWTKDGLVYWCMYGSLSRNELMCDKCNTIQSQLFPNFGWHQLYNSFLNTWLSVGTFQTLEPKYTLLYMFSLQQSGLIVKVVTWLWGW